ncbi:hypothetical protein M0804_003786 [Polistes exclamans]|nr:hypothetical protein M0804_003786 [Polistes exclamans]
MSRVENLAFALRPFGDRSVSVIRLRLMGNGEIKKERESSARPFVLTNYTTTLSNCHLVGGDCGRAVGQSQVLSYQSNYVASNIQLRLPTNERVKRKASEINKMGTFSAGKEWFRNFKKRYPLWNFKFKGETASSNKSAANESSLKFIKVIEENGYVPNQIFIIE